ncbi:phospholipid carrier-dependent glycosyltransferase [Glutamicibacter sp. M10]|uniref:phospholipid carrier-dependent glycosyltransferase n=1 Tax=Glutamicibacter sp. M10 TaxID=3023076 RepID=UPI0021C9B243|nr:phospholipid carrier-dependent glycosyltransferase [Glutamicibacter sp. M10]UXN32698.1 phospholipid carrier-dependent glycosyltransferase [Glutamicibacter sp. M10]
MPHLLLVPLVQLDPLFHSGWAAALLGSFSLAGTAAGLYRIVARLGIGRAGRLSMVLMLVTNPSVLYLYTTALTEPVLLLFLVAALSGLTRWALGTRRMSAGELAIFAGLPTAAAILSRYEGWMLALTGTMFVILVTIRRTRSVRQVMIMGAGFAWIPALSVLWWLAYNWGIYGDPLEFMFGQYSASAQQSSISGSGLLPTKETSD